MTAPKMTGFALPADSSRNSRLRATIGHFPPSPDAADESDVLCCIVPAGIGTKRQLLRVLAAGLRFPGWAGLNWDALRDVLSDLSWLPHREVWLIHADIPFTAGRHSQGLYLDVLGDALESWSTAQPAKLRVSFPAKTAGFFGQ